MNEPLAFCNSLVILATCLVSFFGFSHRDIEEKYVFHPESILAGKEYYRMITAAFLHSGWQHLVLNMLSLYLFGNVVELFFGRANFLLIYFGSILGGSLLSLYVHRHHAYLAYGASGGVCGMIFAHILLLPGTGVNLYFIPLAVPGWLYAIGFLAGSFLALQKGRDNIGHDAHLGGAIVGLLIAAALHPEAVHYNWRVFLVVLVASVLLLVYLWVNPLLLSASAFSARPHNWNWNWKRKRGRRTRQDPGEVDAILEKVSKGGIHTLTAEEKALLESVSDKYRRRAETKKPESGLAI